MSDTQKANLYVTDAFLKNAGRRFLLGIYHVIIFYRNGIDFQIVFVCMETVKDKSYYRQKGLCFGICQTCLYARMCTSGSNAGREFEKLQRVFDLMNIDLRKSNI